MNTATQPTTTTASASKSVAETTTFQYSVLGQLKQTCNDDGLVTCLIYYNADQLPVLTTLLATFKLENDTALTSAMALTCPVVPDAKRPPVMAQWQYMTFPDQSTHPISLSLYGYAQAKTDNKGMLVPDTVLTVEGVSVDTGTAPWTVSKTTGRKGLLVTLEQVEKTADHTVITRTKTTWYKNNAGRQTQKMVETQQNLPQIKAQQVKSTAPLQQDGAALTAVIDQKIRSIYSGRILKDTEQDELGRPTSQTLYTYDARGRETSATTYPYNASSFTSIDLPKTVTHCLLVERQETGDGSWVATLGPDGRWGRTLHDGLQRPVRRELQIVAGNDRSPRNFCLLEETQYGADGNIERQVAYDYLPGGLCRSNEGEGVSEELHDWFWEASTHTHEKAQGMDSKTTTDTALGTLTYGLQLQQRHTQYNSNAGEVTEILREWLPSETAECNASVQTTRKTNIRGLLCELTETEPGADGSLPTTPTRIWSITYDELHRRESLTCPDNAVVRWTYEGLSEKPQSVTMSNNTNTPLALASQTTSSQTRGNLTTQYAKNSTSLPSGTRLVKELEADGNGYSWFAETGAGTSVKRTRLATFAYTPLTRAISASREAEGTHQSLVTATNSAPELLGLHQQQRSVRNLQQSTKALLSLRGSLAAVHHASGVTARTWNDARGLRNRVRRGKLDYLYSYGAKGECRQLSVRGAHANSHLLMTSHYDGHEREIERIYSLGGKPVVRYVQTWTAAGQLRNKTLYRDGSSTPAKTETFSYDSTRGWLLDWTVTSTTGNEVKDASGKVIAGQSYQYDVLANLTQCVTRYADKSEETRVYTYNASYPTQRSSVAITLKNAQGQAGPPKPHTYTYDANGNLTANEHGQTMSYTATGQLAAVFDSDGTVLSSYEYDADQRLAAQWDARAQQRRVLLYSGNQRCGEVWQDASGAAGKRRIDDEEAGLVVQVCNPDASLQTVFTLRDPHNGSGDEYCLNKDGQWEFQPIAFTPWGEAPLVSLNALLGDWGFNDQRVDPVTGCYHLGDGYRAYDPRDKAFGKADELSPFNARAGLNDRAYCNGDPVNWHDPSGHIMLSRQSQLEGLASYDQMIRDSAPPPPPEAASGWDWFMSALLSAVTILGAIAAVLMAIPTGGMSLILAGALLVTAVVAASLEFASLALRQSNPALSESLGWAALGVGLVDVALVAVKAVRIAGKLALRGVQRLNNLRKAARFQGFAAFARPARVHRYVPRTSAAHVATRSGTRALAFNSRYKGVKMVWEKNRKPHWYHEQVVSKSNHDVHFWGADTSIVKADLLDPIGQIDRRGSASSVHIYSGAHGSPNGNNWVDAPPGLVPMDLKRAWELDENAFFQQDLLAYGGNKNPFEGKNPRNIHIHQLDSTIPVPNLDTLEDQPGHHILAFCFGRNDERLLFNHQLPSVISYRNPKTLKEKWSYFKQQALLSIKKTP